MKKVMTQTIVNGKPLEIPCLAEKDEVSEKELREALDVPSNQKLYQQQSDGRIVPVQGMVRMSEVKRIETLPSYTQG